MAQCERDRLGACVDKTAILLAVVLVTLTVPSAGALQPIDVMINTLPRRSKMRSGRFSSYGSTRRFASRGPTSFGVVALHLAYWHRSWRPIVLRTGGVFGMICLVASISSSWAGHTRAPTTPLSSRRAVSRSRRGTGRTPFSSTASCCSSSCATGRYGRISPRLAYCIARIAFLQAVVSIYLHFHWFSDLATGMVAGAFALRLTIKLDEMIPEGARRSGGRSTAGPGRFCSGEWTKRARPAAPSRSRPADHSRRLGTTP